MEAHYSKESLNEIAGGDEEFMAVVARTFLEEIPPDLNALSEAVDNDNKQLAYQFAHKMKPNIEMFGIDLLADITAIEDWSKTTKPNTAIEDNLETIFNTLSNVFNELKRDFEL